ncbi:MAG TPA: hypothetical protein VG267_01080 [Terracidiphilus sp.]|jgi:hypothetical protein|nr:hypothetical protein [Terracidiphilus sp.]
MRRSPHTAKIRTCLTLNTRDELITKNNGVLAVRVISWVPAAIAEENEVVTLLGRPLAEIRFLSCRTVNKGFAKRRASMGWPSPTENGENGGGLSMLQADGRILRPFRQFRRNLLPRHLERQRHDAKPGISLTIVPGNCKVYLIRAIFPFTFLQGKGLECFPRSFWISFTSGITKGSVTRRRFFRCGSVHAKP